MSRIKRYILLFIILALLINISGCGLRGFVKSIQQNIENFGATTRTGQGKY